MRYSIIIPALFAASTIAAPAVKIVTNVEVVRVTVTAGTPEASAYAAKQQGQGYVQAAPPAPPAVQKPKGHGHKHSHKPKPTPAPTPAPAPAPPVQYTPAPAPAPSPEPAPAPAPSPEPAPAPAPSPEPEPAPAPSYTAAPAPEPSQPSSGSGSNDGSPMSGGKSVLSIFNSYRARYGMEPATWDDSLAQNAQKTGDDGHGRDQIHQLPELTSAGSCGQVITPGSDVAEKGYGSDTPFDVAMLSWLCEVVTEEIAADCPQALSANMMDVSGTQEHHKALTEKAFTKVGCAFAKNDQADPSTPWKGLWTCSLRS